MPIEWDASTMFTGQADIDEQHQEWILAFNQFERVVQEGKGIDSLRGALNFFAQYAERHFALEEARMAQLNCPSADANRAGHGHFRKMISTMQKHVRQTEIQFDQVIALQIELANWLIEHICTIDIEMRSAK
jgi:hemerythrin